MRAEEKELDGPDLERDQRTEPVVERDEEGELPVLGGEELRTADAGHRSLLLDAVRLILAGERVTVGNLHLPLRESLALEALQAAVEGQDHMGDFVFAEDRRSLLEQSLAVLQQNLTYGEPAQLAELHAKFDDLTETVATLRDRLVNLEDAQDDLLDEKRTEGKAATESDEGDKGDGDQPAPLDGPERPEPVKGPSTLSDGGPAAAERAELPSTLSHGPERPAPAPVPSTLGADEDPDGESAKKAWWRRPFG